MNIKRFKSWFALLGLVFVSQAVANAPLKGLATMEKLNHPIYLAGVSGNPPSSVDSFVNSPSAFSMHAKYVIDKYSSRQNSQLWLNALLVSSSRQEIGKMESAVLTFRKIVRTEMRKGDELTFKIAPGAGTQIMLNGVEVATIEAPAFQIALIKYWFGNRLTSKQFADDIRKIPSTKQLKIYEQLVADKSRQAVAVTLRTSLNETIVGSIESESSAKEKNKAAAHSAVAKTTKTKESAKSKPKAKVAKKDDIKSSQSRAINEREKSKAQSNKRQSQTTGIKKQKAVITKKQEPALNNQQEPSKKPAQLFDELYATLIEDYTNELIEYIEHKARPTPPLKVRRKPKGDAILSINFSVAKSKMEAKNISLIEGDFDERLITALEQSITGLKKIPLAPEAIQAKTFKIQVKLNFNKCKRSTSAWICL